MNRKNLRHACFGLLPKNLQNRVGSRFPPFVSSFAVRLGNGREIAFSGIHQSEMFKSLYWQGVRGYEWRSVKLFHILSESSRCTFDIGAYFGYYSLVAGSVNPATKIVAFEPFPASFGLMKKLLELNNLNVRAENMALGNQNGTATFYVPDRSHSKLPNICSLKNKFKPGEMFDDRGFVETDVRSATLDTWCTQNDISAVDLIKIDVEGYELDVISNGMEVIQDSKPDIIGEIVGGGGGGG